MDMKLELVVVPVSDVDRAREFYEQCGFGLDVDHAPSDDFRVVQLTPPGSACSIAIGVGITTSDPGSAKGLHLVVEDIVQARGDLVGRGVEVGEPFHFGPAGRAEGVDPQRGAYNTFATFGDPDGNMWLLQEVRRAEPAS